MRNECIVLDDKMMNLPFGRGDRYLFFEYHAIIDLVLHLEPFFDKELACEIQRKIDNTNHSCG